nr:STAS domain-containing protein [Planosporangium thailandense]
MTRSTTSRGAVRLVTAGEIDICNVDRLRTTLESIISEPAVESVTLDLTDLRYIDSMGVSALIFGLRMSQQNGTAFEVVNARGEVRRVLRILGLEPVLAPTA